jgi:SAM-dependent methyltransferase
MLEIGCASGSFMHKMFLDGWDVEGIELSPLAAENARSLGYPVHTGSIETATPLKKPFDLIVGWMVIEHLYDPVRSLEELRNWIKPDGWLVISLPDAGSLEFRIFGNAWYALQLPAHLYHYTPETLRAVLLRSGWRIERIFYQRVLYNLFPSIGYVLSDMGIRNSLTEGLIKFSRQAGIVNFFLYPVSLLLGAMGQTGRITVWARRAND